MCVEMDRVRAFTGMYQPPQQRLMERSLPGQECRLWVGWWRAQGAEERGKQDPREAQDRLKSLPGLFSGERAFDLTELATAVCSRMTRSVSRPST